MSVDVIPTTPKVRVYSKRHLDDLIRRGMYLFRLTVADPGSSLDDTPWDIMHEINLTVRPKGFYADWSEHSQMSDFGYDMLSHILDEWKDKYNVAVYCLDSHWSAHEIAQETAEWGTL